MALTVFEINRKTDNNYAVNIDADSSACYINELMQMDVPFEFQNWVVQRLFGRVSARKSSDMGIDGFTFEGVPIQVKQSDDIGRNVVDNFETAIRRRNQMKGIIVAFSFGKGAYEEIARAKLHDNIEIRVMMVKELLKNQNQDRL